MKTLGIDLSADPAKTGACAVDWEAGTVTLLPRPTNDRQLVQATQDAAVVAIDVPLGWPDPFIDALIEHRDRTGWPPLGTSPPADRTPLRFRRTDVVLQSRGSRPLSVSTDRIGVAAMRGARLQQMFSSAGITVDRSGLTGKVIEAYPAAALRIWGLVSTGYKGRPNVDACRALASSLIDRCAGLRDAASDCLDGCDDDALDAFVCALVARASALGLTEHPGDADIETARREGWIHIPTADIATVVGVA